MTSIFNTAVASMNAMKIMIDQTINNINKSSNKNSEKRLSLENTMQDTNLNTAVKVKEIYDNYNDFIEEEKRKTSLQVTSEQTKLEQLLKLEDLFCEKSDIFNILIQNLYEQIRKNVVFDRQKTIDESVQDGLSEIILALKDFDRKLKFLEKEIKNSVVNIIQQANSLIDKIHDINIDIHYSPMSQFSNRADSLINQRDSLVDELNDLIGVKIVKSNDSYKLYLSNGFCIVDNNQKQNLIALTSISDEKYVSVGYFDNVDKKVKKIEYMIPNGSLGALLKFRREELENAKNKVGQLTINFINSINSYHTLGYDTFGHLGYQNFKISDPEIISSSTNHSSPIISSKWIATNNAQDSDYIIYFKDNSWKVTRLSDHFVIHPNVHQENNSILMTFDGIEFKLEGNNADGDIYMIKPYSKTLENLELLVNQNNFFGLSLINDENQINRNDVEMMNKLHAGNFVNHKETLDESYQKFSKSIAYKCNTLEEELPFKKIMVEILHDKKISMSNDVEQDYQDLNYQQACYLASVKVLKTAESIFNEIVDCYS